MDMEVWDVVVCLVLVLSVVNVVEIIVGGLGEPGCERIM
jgi:hypothetical protein